jgi:hypothetical protein
MRRTLDQRFGRRLKVDDRFEHDSMIAVVERVNDCAAYVRLHGGTRHVEIPERESFVRGRGLVVKPARAFDAAEVSALIAVSARSIVELLP